MTTPSAPKPLFQSGQQVQMAPFNPLSTHMANINISGVVTLVPPVETADKLLIQALTQSIYFTLDGTDPIPTGTVVGFRLQSNDPPLVIGISYNTVVKVVEELATASIQYQWGE